MLYPATYDPPLSVEVAQARETAVAVVVDIARLVGTVGGVESTVTVVVAVLVPFAFEAVRVYVMVDVGFTVVEPIDVLVLNDPGVMAMFVTVPVAFQERVEVPAEATTLEDAVKKEMVGGGGGAAASNVAKSMPPFPVPMAPGVQLIEAV
jgi:hypothetical protein